MELRMMYQLYHIYQFGGVGWWQQLGCINVSGA